MPDSPPIKIYYWSEKYWSIGITEVRIGNTMVKIYDKEKSVCDAIRFRNKVGLDVMKEVLKNAIAHKDYSSGNPIQIKVYEDRIIFWNAGQLPESLTIDSLLTEHPSIPYNPDIATTFFRAGLIEAWGRGTLKIIDECREAELPIPIFSNDSSGFRIEFKKAAGESSEKSSEKIIEMIKSNSSVTIAELADHIGISTRAVEKQLAKLKDESRIKRIGAPKGGHWEVIEK